MPSLSKLCAAKIEIYHYYEQNCTSPKSTVYLKYAGSFTHDLHRKFLFLDFTARKRNIFSRPGLSHFAILQKCFAALPQSLRKVEADSTSCNACCNKNVARLDDCDVTPCNFACNCVTTTQQICVM